MKIVLNYMVGKTLGEGTYGKVKLGVHLETKQKFALKFVKLETSDNQFREVEIMKLLEHPSIVRLYEVLYLPESKEIVLVMEFVSGGELYDLIVQNDKLTEEHARKLFRQILCALKYCHDHLVIHRDLKPENILLDDDGNVKITDFGVSNMMRPGIRLSSQCGTKLYSAPEILTSKSYIGPEVDIWSLGVILYNMVTGCIPWEGECKADQIRNAIEGIFVVPEGVSEGCLLLICRMLEPDPKKRATLSEVFMHPWVNRGGGVPLSACLTVLPTLKRDQVDTDILLDMTKLGFESESVILALEENNPREYCVGLYHLLAKNKAKRKKEESSKETTSPEAPPSPTSAPRFFGMFRRDSKSKFRRSLDFEIGDPEKRSPLVPRKIKAADSAQAIQLPVQNIAENLEAKLIQSAVTFKKDTKKGVLYSCKDEKTKVKWELEICELEGHPEVKLIVHKRKKGDLQSYKALVASLVSLTYIVS
eukprot:CAMPEP_0168560702 /NCGR_PEP_ID=MMETSP0413-20121227/11201_1 /TAXON_ID=136452 /ORGANISM="Filamoeba nolandi, Strain NC-AS-23-1" /LENGTH=476 /DNA_ID=CAMNT_0008592021 /DNA_START=139 /DNA_END=1569 /DNA_ORIENTATION=+